jgi:hypothetical protein
MMKMKTRKLYQIRITKPGHTFGTGLKLAFMADSAVAARIAARLRRAGIDASISPMEVTPEQSAYLARRYDANRIGMLTTRSET